MSYEFLEIIGKIELSFALEKKKLNWCDIQFGYENKFVGWKDVVDFARKQTTDDSLECFSISTVTKENIHEIQDLLKILAHSCDIDKAKWTWLYLSLHWAQARTQFDSIPLPILLDMLCADFGYPEICENLVTHSPSIEPKFLDYLRSEVEISLQKIENS